MVEFKSVFEKQERRLQSFYVPWEQMLFTGDRLEKQQNKISRENKNNQWTVNDRFCKRILYDHWTIVVNGYFIYSVK